MNRFKSDLFFDLFGSSLLNPSFYETITRTTNVSDNETEYVIRISVPGLTKDDINTKLKNGILEIYYEEDKSKETPVIFTKPFSKSYELPNDSDEKNIVGKVENGVLELIIPKIKKKALERFIAIN